jgi:hypothetical protein
MRLRFKTEEILYKMGPILGQKMEGGSTNRRSTPAPPFVVVVGTKETIDALTKSWGKIQRYPFAPKELMTHFPTAIDGIILNSNVQRHHQFPKAHLLDTITTGALVAKNTFLSLDRSFNR